MRWTKPYHGVEHVEDLWPSHQITVETYSATFSRATMLHLHGLHPFTAVKETTGTRAECVATAELWFQTITRKPA